MYIIIKIYYIRIYIYIYRTNKYLYNVIRTTLQSLIQLTTFITI